MKRHEYESEICREWWGEKSNREMREVGGKRRSRRGTRRVRLKVKKVDERVGLKG